MLASLANVDWVGINHTTSAEPVLDTVRPDIYVKGSDYENPDDDVTGKIKSERDVVERHGGRIVFTRDVTFSSSSLVNRYFDIYDPPLRDYLQQVREGGGAERLLKLIDSVQDMHVVLVGDTIIDEYQYVSALGKPSKENIVATLFRSREQFAGGVIAAANHVASFCKSVEIVTMLGGDDYPEGVHRGASAPEREADADPRRGTSDDPQTAVCRTRLSAQAVRSLHHERYAVRRGRAGGDRPHHQRARAPRRRRDRHRFRPRHDRVEHDRRADREFEIPRRQRPKQRRQFRLQSGHANIRSADYICIDAPEARLATADKFSDIASVIEKQLHGRIDCDNIIVTHGSFGCYPFSAKTGVARVPAFTKTVVDTVGAGDAFLTITAPLVAAGGDIKDVAFIGNAAGAIKVGIVGHRNSVEKVPLVKFITALLK